MRKIRANGEEAEVLKDEFTAGWLKNFLGAGPEYSVFIDNPSGVSPRLDEEQAVPGDFEWVYIVSNRPKVGIVMVAGSLYEISEGGVTARQLKVELGFPERYLAFAKFRSSIMEELEFIGKVGDDQIISEDAVWISFNPRMGP